MTKLEILGSLRSSYTRVVRIVCAGYGRLSSRPLGLYHFRSN